MKKRLLIFSLLPIFIFSQEFQPSQQASGYLDNKGVTVDYSTGIFHYSLPLLEVKSGDYTLPIKLNYSGKGVQVNTFSEYLGYNNWNLQAGGVVTRIIRGLPDEDPHNGILRSYETGETYSRSDIYALKKDGENDIFLASFNGKNIPFIMVYSREVRRFKAEPLIKTNVKIEPIYSLGTYGAVHQIKITDTDGSIYLFGEKEYISNLNYSDVSNSYISSGTYTSSWFLSEIKAINSDIIKFNYFKQHEISYKGKIQKNSVAKKYIYSTPLIEPNYSLISGLLTTLLSQITVYADEVGQDLADYYILISMKPNYLTETVMNSVQNAAGTLRHLDMLDMSLDQILMTANSIIGYYSNKPDISHLSSSQEVVRTARNIIDIIALFRGGQITENVSDRLLATGGSSKISAVLLKSIEASGHIIYFEYDIRDSNIPPGYCFLKAITSTKNSFPDKKIYFSKGCYLGLLDKVIVSDPDNNPVSSASFSYYDIQWADRADNWGFHDFSYENVDIATPWYIRSSKSGNQCPAKHLSLQSITDQYGGKIEIEYEKNTLHYGPLYQDCYYGGIRVKELRFHDKNGSLDRIRYKYPLSGKLLFQDCLSMDIIRYPYSSRYVSGPETVYRDRVNLTGNVYINYGNNGIIYPCMQEITEGKGMTVYFSKSNANSQNSTYSYPFWLVGLPEMKLDFDEQNRLKTVYTQEYTTEVMPFNKLISQKRAFEYFIDEQEILDKKNNTNSYLSRLNYSQNILPRTNAIVPSYYDYSIQYGGKVLLKEEKRYAINGCSQSPEEIIGAVGSGSFNIANFSASLQMHREYCYDNPDNSNPTRILSYQSNGDIIAERHITPLECSGSDSVITGMKAANIISPVLNKQNLLKKKGTSGFLLMDEQITVFDKLTAGVQYAFLPVRQKESQSLYSQGIPIVPSAAVTSVMTRPVNQYRDTNILNYIFTDGLFIPKERIENEIRSLTVYSPDYGKNILALSPVSTTMKEQADAMVIVPENKTSGNDFPVTDEGWKTFSARSAYKFYRFLKSTDLNTLPTGYQALFSGNELTNYESFKGIFEHLETINDYNGFIAYATPERLSNARFWMLRVIHICNADPILQFSIQEIGLANRFLVEQLRPGISEDYYNLYKEINSKKNYYESKKNSLQVSADIATTYQVFVLHKNTVAINYKINNGSNQRKSLSPPSLSDNHWTVNSFDINAGTNSTVTVGFDKFSSERNIAYIMIVPKGESFVASCYDKDKHLFCEFNQNKQATYYTYDSAGRVTESYILERGSSNTREKKLLQSMEYHNNGLNTLPE